LQASFGVTASAGTPRQASYPNPPEIFKEDDYKDVYGRLSTATTPVDAERTLATINHRATNSMDRDGSIGADCYCSE